MRSGIRTIDQQAVRLRLRSRRDGCGVNVLRAQDVAHRFAVHQQDPSHSALPLRANECPGAGLALHVERRSSRQLRET